MISNKKQLDSLRIMLGLTFEWCYSCIWLSRRSDDDGENTPLSLDLKDAKGSKTMEESLQAPIRTYPPTPQCFSATREPVSTPSKAHKSRFKVCAENQMSICCVSNQ